MTELNALIVRNTKLFFKDKGMFFTALVTPIILLVLYMTFLAKIYRDTFAAAFPADFVIDEGILDAIVSGQLVSSLLAVCCVTVSFCSNMLMVQDKVTGAYRDLTVTPVRSYVMALGYYFATLFATLIICFTAMGAGFAYIGVCGWYLSVSDVLLVMLDVVLLVMFGIALSSIINFFLSSQGQISAVGTVISAGYGFICGAYMPISQFGSGLQKVLSFLPGTYATSLLRNHCMQGAFNELAEMHVPDEAIEVMRDTVDCNVYFFDNVVSEAAMFTCLGCCVLILTAAYVMMNVVRGKRAH